VEKSLRRIANTIMKAASAIKEVPIKPTFTMATSMKPAYAAPDKTHDANATAVLALR